MILDNTKLRTAKPYNWHKKEDSSTICPEPLIVTQRDGKTNKPTACKCPTCGWIVSGDRLKDYQHPA